MTREEIIKEAAAEHRDTVCCGFYDPIADARQESFVEGAEWADEHPKHGTVNKQEFIEKACDWLVSNAEDSVESALYLVAKFKRAMEE